MFILVCLSTLTLFLSCVDAVNKAKEKTNKALEEKLEKTKTQEAVEQGSKKETVEPEGKNIDNRSEKADIEWWQKNFKITYLFSPGSILGGSSAMDIQSTMQRYDDVLHINLETAGQKINMIYQIEDGQVVKYTFNPANKKAQRTVLVNQERTLDYYAKNNLTEHTVVPTKSPRKSNDFKQDGEEKIVGRKCEKWISEKNFLGTITRATSLIDAEYGFALRTDIYMKFQDKEQSGTSLTVSEVSFIPDRKDVVIDFSEYELVQ
jgi:hypothetical protein